MLDRGKLAVVTMFAVALAAAAFAWWWNYSRGQRALAFYGPRAAHLIRTAPKVELLVLGTGDSDPVELLLESGPVTRIIDISRAPGLVHARTALLDDASYDWDDAVVVPQMLKYCLRFSDRNDQVVLTLGTPSGRILIEGSGRGSEQLVKKTADGWLAFIERNIKQAEKRTANTDLREAD